VTVTPTSPSSSASRRSSPTPARRHVLVQHGQITSLKDATWNASSSTRDQTGERIVEDPGSRPRVPAVQRREELDPQLRDVDEPGDPRDRLDEVFAGQRADGFYVDLGSIFDLGRPAPFQPDFLLKAQPSPGQLWPRRTCTPSPFRYDLGADQGGAVPGTYTDATRRSASGRRRVDRRLKIYSTTPQTNTGPWEQVSRLGNPFDQRGHHPMGHKDRWNSRRQGRRAVTPPTTTTRDSPRC